ncbi:MAG: Eco47II family restriction endonuclease [Lachnospiraceae bacterium]|nr:Eco47II family restriction endonuclease [Lachnospiraceae bacterium]
MNWNINFITREELKEHITKTIESYGEKLKPYDIKKMNSNLLDPIKMIFDKYVYQESWEDLVSGEIFRQRDKSNNNSIGYFHQRIFNYFEYCYVPDNGRDGGWDVIFEKPEGIILPTGEKVSRIFVEMKNKHNTMNSASAGKTYIKMQNQLLRDDDCACFLVEAIAKQSQNIKWETSVDGQKVSHKRIRRVSIDQFYALVTGQEDAFYQVCLVLPNIINEVVSSGSDVSVPKDSAFKELSNIAASLNLESEDLSIAMAIYLLGFSSYEGFSNGKNTTLAHLYEYAKRLT